MLNIYIFFYIEEFRKELFFFMATTNNITGHLWNFCLSKRFTFTSQEEDKVPEAEYMKKVIMKKHGQ